MYIHHFKIGENSAEFENRSPIRPGAASLSGVGLFLFLYFLKSGIDKLMEWSTIPACPNLMCFFNRGDTEGTNSSKILCPMFVYVLFYVDLCHD